MEVKTSFVSGVIAFGIIMGICYVAGSVIQTVLVSILLAIFLDPVVELEPTNDFQILPLPYLFLLLFSVCYYEG